MPEVFTPGPVKGEPVIRQFKPMLAAKANPDKLKFPVIAQPKLDGIRVSVVGGRALTRTLKEVPNREVFEALSRPEFEGLDGEIIVGSPTADDAYRRTCSFVMAPNKTGEPWCFHVFDRHDTILAFRTRYADLEDESGYWDSARMQLVDAIILHDHDMLETWEASLVAAGHEGVILRDPHALYKFGRASATKGELLKLKRFEDFEAEVIGVYEEMHNANERYENELGRGQRSSAKAGLVGKGRLGGLILRGLNTGWEGVEFRCGTGFDHEQRAALWIEANYSVRFGDLHRGIGLNGRVAKIKCFPVGVKDKPRHPVFLGWREAGA